MQSERLADEARHLAPGQPVGPVELDPSAKTRGPSCTAAAPIASEVCSGWRGWTLHPQSPHLPRWIVKRRTISGGGGGTSVWSCSATPVSSTTPSHLGHAPAAARRSPRRHGPASRGSAGPPYSFPGFRPGVFGFRFGSPFENGEACRFPARSSSSIRASRRVSVSAWPVIRSSRRRTFCSDSSRRRWSWRSTLAASPAGR